MARQGNTVVVILARNPEDLTEALRATFAARRRRQPRGEPPKGSPRLRIMEARAA